MKRLPLHPVFNHYIRVAVFLAHGIFAAVGATVDDQQEKVFTVGPGSFLVMDVDRGGIDVKTSNTQEVRIQVTRQVKRLSTEQGRKVLAEHTVTMEQAAEQVSVRAQFPKDTSLSNREKSGLQVTYRITVPKEFRLDLKTAGGHIFVDDLTGDIKAVTAGGTLRFGRIDGTVHGRTAGGAIKLERVSGPVNVTTAGGAISILEAHNTVVAQTSGGSMKVNLAAQPEGDCRVTTSGGRIDVSLPANLKLDVQAQTSGGRVEADLVFSSVAQRSRTSLQAQLNGGGKRLLLQTSGGDITLRER